MGTLVVETMSWPQVVIASTVMAAAGPLLMLALAWLDRRTR